MTSVNLLPVGDGNVDNFLHEGGGSTSLWTHIDDPVGTPTDTDYIRGQGSYVGPPLCRYILILDDIVLTATERIARMRIHFRVASTAAGVGKAIRYRWIIPNVTSSPMYLAELSTITFTDSAGPWIVPFTTSDPTQQVMINKLRIEFQGSPFSGSSDGNAKISQVYAEMDKRTQATVSGVTVTGNTTTSRPTITATYNDTVDNEDSTRRQFKVFAAGVYGLDSFDPSTSPAAWDSGELLLPAAPGSSMEQPVGADLVDGATYKAYVRASKPFNGTPWWTNWVASSAFTMVLTKPDAPLLLVTGESDLTFSKLRVKADLVGGSTNLLSLVDSNLEASVGTWVANPTAGNCVVAQSATFSNSGVDGGTNSLRLTSSAAGDMSAVAALSPNQIPIVAGRTYTLAAALRAGTAGRTISLGVLWDHVDGTQTVTFPVGADVTGSFTTFSQAFTAPAQAVRASVVVFVRSTGAAGEQHYLDTVAFREGTSAVWQAGGAASDKLHLERAILNDGTLNLAHPQIASGTETTGAQDGFFTNQSSDVLFSDDRSSVMGRRSLGWKVSNTASKLTIGLPLGTFTLDQTAYVLAAIPSSTMVLSLYAAGPVGAMAATLALEAVDQAGTVLGSPATKSITIPATATSLRFSIQLAVHASAVFLRASILNTSGTTGQTINIDGIQLREGTDPDSQAWAQGQGLSPAWTLVRGADLLEPATIDDPRIVLDEEVPLNRVLAYRATVVRAPDATTRVSSNPTVAPTIRLPLPADVRFHVLKDPMNPQLAMPVRLMAGPEQIIEDTEVSRPIGRPDPIVQSAGMTGRDRQLLLLAEGVVAVATLEQLMLVRNALLLQFAAGGMRYVRLTSREFDLARPGDDPALFVTADTLEVGAPV